MEILPTVPLVANGTIGNQRTLNVVTIGANVTIGGNVGTNGTIGSPSGTICKPNGGSVRGSPNGTIGNFTNGTIGLVMVPVEPLGELMVPLALPLVQMI